MTNKDIWPIFLTKFSLGCPSEENRKKKDPNLDLSSYQPDRKSLEKVEKVILKLKEQGNEEFYDKDGKVKLGFIHKAMNGQLDYETIRLARLYVD